MVASPSPQLTAAHDGVRGDGRGDAGASPTMMGADSATFVRTAAGRSPAVPAPESMPAGASSLAEALPSSRPPAPAATPTPLTASEIAYRQIFEEDAMVNARMTQQHADRAVEYNHRITQNVSALMNMGRNGLSHAVVVSARQKGLVYVAWFVTHGRDRARGGGAAPRGPAHPTDLPAALHGAHRTGVAAFQFQPASRLGRDGAVCRSAGASAPRD